MINVGVDIIEISRFAQVRYLDRVAEFFLTPQEIAAIKHPSHKLQYLASRFAAKEAVIKALPEPIEFHEFEIIKHGLKPAVRFLNSKFDKYQVSVSLSHATGTAIGFAVAQFL